MNRNEQEYYRNIERIANALEKIAEKLGTRQHNFGSGPILVKKANRIKHI